MYSIGQTDDEFGNWAGYPDCLPSYYGIGWDEGKMFGPGQVAFAIRRGYPFAYLCANGFSFVFKQKTEHKRNFFRQADGWFLQGL